MGTNLRVVASSYKTISDDRNLLSFQEKKALGEKTLKILALLTLCVLLGVRVRIVFSLCSFPVLLENGILFLVPLWLGGSCLGSILNFQNVPILFQFVGTSVAILPFSRGGESL